MKLTRRQLRRLISEAADSSSTVDDAKELLQVIMADLFKNKTRTIHRNLAKKAKYDIKLDQDFKKSSGGLNLAKFSVKTEPKLIAHFKKNLKDYTGWLRTSGKKYIDKQGFDDLSFSDTSFKGNDTVVIAIKKSGDKFVEENVGYSFKRGPNSYYIRKADQIIKQTAKGDTMFSPDDNKEAWDNVVALIKKGYEEKLYKRSKGDQDDGSKKDGQEKYGTATFVKPEITGLPGIRGKVGKSYYNEEKKKYYFVKTPELIQYQVITAGGDDPGEVRDVTPKQSIFEKFKNFLSKEQPGWKWVDGKINLKTGKPEAEGEGEDDKKYEEGKEYVYKQGSNYTYFVKGGEWYTRNKSTKNITGLGAFPDAVAAVNKKFKEDGTISKDLPGADYKRTKHDSVADFMKEDLNEVKSSIDQLIYNSIRSVWGA